MLTDKELQKLAFLLQERKLEKMAGPKLMATGGALVGGALGYGANEILSRLLPKSYRENPEHAERRKIIKGLLIGGGTILGGAGGHKKGVNKEIADEIRKKWKFDF